MPYVLAAHLVLCSNASGLIGQGGADRVGETASIAPIEIVLGLSQLAEMLKAGTLTSSLCTSVELVITI